MKPLQSCQISTDRLHFDSRKHSKGLQQIHGQHQVFEQSVEPLLKRRSFGRRIHFVPQVKTDEQPKRL